MSAERKYLAHLIDAAFDRSYNETDYVRLGADLEEYNVELNPEVETKRNILGENAVYISGYEASSDVDPFYYEYDEALSKKIWDLVQTRATGDACKTSTVDVLLSPSVDEGGDPIVIEAWREDCIVVPQSYGGDTTGIQLPFAIHRTGNRAKGTFDMKTMKFTEE